MIESPSSATAKFYTALAVPKIRGNPAGEAEDAFLHEDIAARNVLQIILRLAWPYAKSDAEQYFRKVDGALYRTKFEPAFCCF